MRICILTPQLSSYRSTGLRVRRVASRLARRGCEVLVVAPAAEAAQAADVDFEVLGIDLGYAPPKTLFFGLKSVKLLKGLGLGFDVVESQWMGYLALGSFSSLGRLVQVVHSTWLGEMHALVAVDDVASFLKHASYWQVLSLLERKSCEKADKVVAVSRHLAREVVKYYHIPEDKVDVVYNGVDLERFSAHVGVEEARAQLGLDAFDYVFLYVGRFFGRKGVEYLIKAFASLPKQLGGGALVLVGDGPLESKLRRLSKELGVEDRVRFSTMVPENLLPTYYHACDALVLPSTYEPLGIVLLEAMACGKPVIATKVGGIPEIVDGEVGFLVEPRSIEALSAAMEAIASDASLAKRLGEAGRRRAELFSWDRAAEEMYGVYERVLGVA